MRAFRIIAACLLSALPSGFATLNPPVLADDDLDLRIIHMQEGQVVLEVVGEVINSGTPAPLGSSNQFGYVSFLKGVDAIFSGSPANETTARITFFTEVTTTRVTSHGPFSIVLREGTTTLYLNSPPADFSSRFVPVGYTDPGVNHAAAGHRGYARENLHRGQPEHDYVSFAVLTRRPDAANRYPRGSVPHVASGSELRPRRWYAAADGSLCRLCRWRGEASQG